jgi:uncharacterized protein YndB with AHSA1/START domain
MLKHIVVGLTSAFAAFFTYVAIQPAAFTVARSTTIAAPPAAVFAHVDELRKWDAWSPWAKKDPNARFAYGGPRSGVGSEFAWSGNNDVGEGKMTIVESHPNERIGIRLDFVKPFTGSSNVAFDIRPDGDRTSVTWSISGRQDFIERAFMLMMGIRMDDMIGADYEKGLAALKAVVETTPKR